MKPRRITVVLADDNAAVRHSVRGLLEADTRFSVIGEAKNGREAVKAALTLNPDVVLMDIAMPVQNGLDATHQILSAGNAARIIILSAYEDEEYLAKAKEVGAVGFLPKQMFAKHLTDAIHKIATGRTYFIPLAAEHTSAKPKIEAVAGKTRRQPLTARELRILHHLANGLPKKQIAVKLRVNVTAIEKVLRGMMTKLGMPSLAHLAAIGGGPKDLEGDVVLTIT